MCEVCRSLLCWLRYLSSFVDVRTSSSQREEQDNDTRQQSVWWNRYAFKFDKLCMYVCMSLYVLYVFANVGFPFLCHFVDVNLLVYQCDF